MELGHPIISDTDFLSDYLAGTASAKRAIITLLKEGFYLVTTSITVGELYYGRYRRKWHQKRASILETFLSTLNILSFSWNHAREYGKIRASLLDMGLDIGFADTAIAAIARVEDLPLFTGNLEHFNRIQGVNIREYIH